MSNLKRPFTIIILSLLFIGSVDAQNDWRLKKDDDGIKVYIRETPNSAFKSVRVNTRVHATLSQVVSILMDVKNTPTWIYHTKSAILLKQVSPAELYYYSEVQIPWPAQNRDFIAHLMVTQNPHTRVVTLDAPCISDYIPEKNGITRVRRSEGRWVLTPKADHEVDIEYTITLDPGGNLPSWIVNMFAAEGPTNIFKGLRKELLKPLCANTQLSYIIN